MVGLTMTATVWLVAGKVRHELACCAAAMPRDLKTAIKSLRSGPSRFVTTVKPVSEVERDRFVNERYFAPGVMGRAWTFTSVRPHLYLKFPLQRYSLHFSRARGLLGIPIQEASNSTAIEIACAFPASGQYGTTLQ
jgi:hypothetical protein